MTWNGGQALPPGIGRWPSSSITKVAAGWHLAGVNGGDRDGPNEDRLTRQEEVLLERMLRHQAGVDPFHLGQVLDLAAVGIVNSAWRNSPVADWRAGDGPLTDGDMLRINAHTTWRVREIMRRWRSEIGMVPDSPATALDHLDVDATDLLAVRIWRWLVNPRRRLPMSARPGRPRD